MSVFAVFANLVEHLADLLQPLFDATAAAAAIVLFTALVRLLVHPLSRAAARGQKARTALQPKIAELRTRHKHDPKKLQRARQRYEVNPGWPERFNVWFTNLVGGAPSQPSPSEAPSSES